MSTAVSHDVKAATFNFAADRNDGGRHDNHDATHAELKLTPKDFPVRDARALSPAPSIAVEGFTLAEHHLDNPDWFNEEWIDKVYAPSCEELVKRLTGAKECIQFHRPLKRIANEDERGEHMVTAGFVHIDHPRAVGEEIARMFVEGHGKSFKKAVIYNVWKTFTPPPQNRPLAVTDRRTVPEDAHVVGVTVEEGSETPYVILAPNDEVEFYYYPDMTVDESLVFTGIDFDAENPLGCAHSAFSNPEGGVSRSSVEARIVAIFE